MSEINVTLLERQAEQLLRQDEEGWVDRCCAEIVGASPELLDALQIARMAAEDGDCTVLLSGETGTGKELISQVIHDHSHRKGQPFNAVNAASLPANLADSLLFGHEKGAYTDASTATPGLFLASAGGTVFLDEIQELDQHVQAKLLRFLQDRRVTPLGGNRQREVDVRIIAGSNQDLKKVVDRGAFRADLYFRLNVLPIHLPALRERLEDIPLLVNRFLTELNVQKGGNVTIDQEAMSALASHNWPGNVRELRNLIERLVILRRNRSIRLEDLPASLFPDLHTPNAGLDPRETNLKRAKEQLVAAFEREFIYREWARHNWHITRTAEAIGESRQWLGKQIRKYGLRPGEAVPPMTSGDRAQLIQ